MRSATRTVWRALLVRPLLQPGRNHQMAVVTGGVTSRVGDVPGDSGTTWPRSSRGGEPKRGYQSPPQSSTKPPDSAERYEWLSAAMRRAGRLAGRPFSPCFTLVSRTFHARSLLPSSRCGSLERCQPEFGSLLVLTINSFSQPNTVRQTQQHCCSSAMPNGHALK